VNETRPVRLAGRYLMFDAIASGGMATVRIGRLCGAAGFSRTVAIKQLHPQYAGDPNFVAMFMDEARLASRVRHPNVVAPLDVVAMDGELLIVMEFVHGESLAHLLKTRPAPVPAPIACSILIEVLLGLHAAHEATSEDGEPLEIVHRDISPQNILVGLDGVARVVDFGIAKAASRTQTTINVVKGKLGYIAPEQLRFEPSNRAADIFAAGVVLWELLTGRRLYAFASPAEAIERVLNQVPEPPSTLVPGLPKDLDALTLRALSSDPRDRFRTAASMAEALELVVAPIGAMEVGRWVEAVTGPTLHRRARRIAEIEGMSLSDLTLSPARPAIPPPGYESRAPPTRAGSTEPSAASGADSGEPPPAHEATDLSLVPPPLELDTPIPGLPRGRPQRIALGGALLVLTALAIGWLSFADESTAEPTRLQPVTPPGESLVISATPSAVERSAPALPIGERPIAPAATRDVVVSAASAATVERKATTPKEPNAPNAPNAPRRTPRPTQTPTAFDAWDPNTFGGRR